MKFEKRQNSDVFSINEWEAGPYAIVELAFAFGQHRVQIWYDQPHFSYPDVVPPNF